MRLLLLSNSTSHGQGYLDHAMPEVTDFFGTVKRILFVPYALFDIEGYTLKARERFLTAGIEVEGLILGTEGLRQLERAEGIFVGGGNTFRLLDRLQRSDLLTVIRDRVQRGMPCLGASAGSNLACPSLKTTNDMPIVEPPSFEALDLVPFQINPHYLDPAPGSTHMGETRETRIREFLEENTVPVLGLREGAWLRREGDTLRLAGANGARLFRPGEEPVEYEPGEGMDFLLTGD
ncbi:MAG: dipeptidase PepE [bacterium]